MSGMFFQVFLFISIHISLDMLFLGSAEAYIGRGGKLNGHLMSGCIGNIRIKKLSKSDHWFSSYSQKCWGCFFLRHSVDCVKIGTTSMLCIIISTKRT